jgi:hypothetical protein
MYRQFDGYPEGHGIDLAEFLSGITIVNGLSLDDNSGIANGMGCLAAQIVAHFKTDPGGIYLYPPGTNDVWEEYTYKVSAGSDGNIVMTCKAVYNDEELFSGAPEDFIEWVKTPEEEVA